MLHQEPAVMAGFSLARDCATCGAAYQPVQPHQRYCSRRCYAARSRQRPPHAERLAQMDERAPPHPCAACAKPFPRHRDRTTYCSRVCQRNAPRIGLSCAVLWVTCRCGRRFISRRSARFCSGECRRQHACDAARSSSAARKARRGFVFRCRECDTEVIPAYGDKRRVFCSRECADRHFRREGKRRGLGLRRRQGERVIRRMRARLLARDDGRCGICGLAIDLTLHWTHPLSLTIDHIHPLSAGGTDSEANLWPAHRQCNEEKGDDLGYRIGGLHAA